MPAPQDFETYELGDFALHGGVTLRKARLTYKTWGELNSDRSNVILVPTWYSSQGPGKVAILGVSGGDTPVRV